MYSLPLLFLVEIACENIFQFELGGPLSAPTVFLVFVTPPQGLRRPNSRSVCSGPSAHSSPGQFSFLLSFTAVASAVCVTHGLPLSNICPVENRSGWGCGSDPERMWGEKVHRALCCRLQPTLSWPHDLGQSLDSFGSQLASLSRRRIVLELRPLGFVKIKWGSKKKCFKIKKCYVILRWCFSNAEVVTANI